MAYRHVERLQVFAWGKRVGVVAPSEARRGYAFQYDPQWISEGAQVSPLQMPLPRSRRQTFVFPDLPSDTYYGLPAMLADSVPDRFGNSIVNAHLAREGVSAGDVTALDRLAYVGGRGMGALTFEPDIPLGKTSTTVELSKIVETARAAVRGELNDHAVRTAALNSLLAVGTSAGGARAKAVLAWNRQTGEMRAGGVDAPPGFEQWLLKFDGAGEDKQLGQAQQYTRTEYAYSLMAREAGLEMSECTLLEEGGRAHFMTKRFDRPADGEHGRLHMQSLCAVSALDFNAVGVNSYEDYLLTLGDIGIDDPLQRHEAFRRIVFNVLGSNNDDHTKNLSFLMTPGGQWGLSPAYDVSFAYNPVNKWLRQHLMSVGGKFDNITVGDLQLLGDRFEIPGYRDAISQVASAVGNWGAHATAAGLLADRKREVSNRLNQVWAGARSD